MSYHNKESFGDMDILVHDDGHSFEEIESMISKLNPSQIYKNGNVYSFDYKNLQIDLIFVSPEDWEASKIFYKWGDLGNLMGKLFSSYGDLENFSLKYGYDGIKVKMVYKTYKSVFYLSKDNRMMFDFLGIDLEEFEKGFDDQFKMYDYIITSKLFSPYIFQWENLTSVIKNRNKRRPAYHGFLEYIEKYGKDNKIDYNEDPEFYLNNLNEFFEVNIQSEYQKLIDKVERLKSIRDKFSGRHVMEEMNLKGKSLGDSLENFKKYIVDELEEDYDDFILNESFDEIMELFKNVYENNL